MIFEGEAAVAELAKLAREKDRGSSSFWDLYHQGFDYKDGTFKGLQGFGGSMPPGTALHRLGHWLLQTPYRRHGAGFERFDECVRIAKGIAARQSREFDVDILRHALTASLLLSRLPKEAFSGLIAVIGDGFGTLSSILLEAVPGSRIVAVNLTKTLLVDAVYIRKAAPAVGQALITAAGDRPDARVQLVRADDSALLSSLPVSLAVNVASMQEMDPPVVAAYFALLRATPSAKTWFYCCNREEKILPDGTLVRFDAFPWRPADRIMLDELCPWHQTYYRKLPPFYHPYDGPVRHRLVELDKS